MKLLCYLWWCSFPVSPGSIWSVICQFCITCLFCKSRIQLVLYCLLFALPVISVLYIWYSFILFLVVSVNVSITPYSIILTIVVLFCRHPLPCVGLTPCTFIPLDSSALIGLTFQVYISSYDFSSFSFSLFGSLFLLFH